MNLYVSAKSQVPDLVIEYFEIILANGRCVNIQWAESSVKREKDDYTICFKRLQFDNGNYNVTIADLSEFDVAQIGLYSDTHSGKLGIKIEEMEFAEESEKIVKSDPYRTEDYDAENKMWDKVKCFIVEWVEKYVYDLSFHFDVDDPEDTSGLFDVAYDMKQDVEESEFNPHPDNGVEFDDWYDGYVEYLAPIVRNVTYEKRYGGESCV